MNYTLADVVRMSGAKRRSVQLWADSGILRAYGITERKGTGTHRQFARDEVIIACIINVFSRRQVAIGELQRLGTSIRKFLNSGKRRGLLEEAVGDEEPFPEPAAPPKPTFMVITWTWPHELEDPDVDITDLARMDDKLGGELGQEFAISVLISLHHCLAGLKGS